MSASEIGVLDLGIRKFAMSIPVAPARDMIEICGRQNLYARFRDSGADDHVQSLYTI
jgi:hypothetical protein